jgi:BMFP domain-containing protein YqiC
MNTQWSEAFRFFAMHFTGGPTTPGAGAANSASMRQFLAACEQHIALMQTLSDEVGKGAQGAAQPLFQRLSAWQRTVESGHADPFAILRELGVFGTAATDPPATTLPRAAALQTRALELQGRMLAHGAEIARETMQRFSAQAATVPPEPAALYSIWIECAEEAYAARASSEDYCRTQGELINALNDLRVEQRSQVEQWARVLDLPTRSEINALIQRVRALERAQAPPKAKAKAKANARPTTARARRGKRAS